MPAALASSARPHQNSRHHDSAPPAKKAKLTQQPAALQKNGLKALLNGTPVQKPVAKINYARNATSDRVDDHTATVGGGQGGHGDVQMENNETDVIVISSAEEESDYSSSDEDEDDTNAAAQAVEAASVVNGLVGEEDGLLQDEVAEAEEPSFGDRLLAQHPEPVQESRIVDVSTFVGPDLELKALATATVNRPLTAPNASSLGTVLTQALRTNDTELLDSCLRVIDVDTIYATVERLPSPLVGNLLQKLAERLHKKPGRAGMLMVWVQWSLAAHGGYLASQPQLVKQLTTLNRVLKERASGLQPLLALKGRLDMLQAQLELRRRNQKRGAHDDEDEAVIYVEGEDDYDSSLEGEDIGVEEEVNGLEKRMQEDFDDDSSIDQMPTTMEVNEDSEEGSEDSEGLIDDEAEETGDDGDEMSEPLSGDSDEEDGISESEEELKPERRSTAARAGLKSRR